MNGLQPHEQRAAERRATQLRRQRADQRARRASRRRLANTVPQALALAPTGSPTTTYQKLQGRDGDADPDADGADPAGYPNATGTLSTRLQAPPPTLLAANLGTRVITIHWGGFDTHTDQLATRTSSSRELSRALGAFQADLESRARHRRPRVRARVLGVRPPLQGDAEHDHDLHRRRHRPRRGRADVRDGQGRQRRPGGRSGPAARRSCSSRRSPPRATTARATWRCTTDYRSVYRAVVRSGSAAIPDAVIGGGAIDVLRRGDGKTGLFAHQT